MYIADQYNHRVRKVTISTGIITTIAGTGTATFSGDNGQATSASLNYPEALTLDVSGISLTLSHFTLFTSLLHLQAIYTLRIGIINVSVR